MSSTNICCYNYKCCLKSNNKVTPFLNIKEDENHRVIEIRKGRYISVFYFNPCERAKEFDQQMRIHLDGNKDNIVYRSEVFTKFTKNKEHSEIELETKLNGANLPRQQTGKIDFIKENSTHSNQYNSRNEIVSAAGVNIESEAHFHKIKSTNVSKTNDDESSEFIPLKDCSDQVKHLHKVIFFIHGVGGSADVWREQTSYFAAHGYQLVVPEWIGHGFCPSSKNETDYYFNEIVKDLTLLFDLNCNRTNIVVGHSYGRVHQLQYKLCFKEIS